MIRAGIRAGAILGVLFLCSAVAASGDQAPPQTPQTPPVRRPAAPPPPPKGQWPSQGFISVDGGYQTRSFSFDEVHHDTAFVEESTWQADYKLRDGISFGGAGGGRVWRNLVIAGAYSYARDDNPAAITGSIAHPFFFNQFRSISGESPDLRQEEHGLHISAMWMVPVNRRLEIGILGGPSYFWVTRAFVKEVQFSQSFPFDTATFTGVVAEDASASQLGWHAGADVTWLFTRQVGIGGLVRYTQASVDFATPAGGSVSVDVGGLQIGAGLRVRFARKASAVRPRPIPPGERPPVNAPPGAPGSMPATVGTSAVMLVDAPVFVRPDETRTPLRVLKQGTSIRILEEQGDWVRIEFQDSQYGRRVGYVQRKNIRMIGK